MEGKKNLPISSGIARMLFSPTFKYCKLVSEPIVRGNCESLLEATSSRVSSRNEPISLGNMSILFSSRSSVLSFLRFPIVCGILCLVKESLNFHVYNIIVVLDRCWINFEKKTLTLNWLLLRMSTSRFCSLDISSEIPVSWLVPKLSSTMLVHVPRSMGNDVKWFVFMLSVDKCLANENMLYGILSIWLCCILID